MASSLSADTLLIGHSLFAPRHPAMMNGFIDAKGGSGQVDYQIINGAPLRYQWTNGADAEGVSARAVLPTGKYEVVIMTESIPLQDQITWNDTAGYANRFFDLAVAGNPSVQVYMYETFHNFSGFASLRAWRDGIVADTAKWEGIVNSVNSSLPAGAKPMLIVPVGQAMVRLYDAIEAGRVPGISSIRQLFQDDIHPNDLGAYFAAMVHYATVYGLDPDDLPEQTADMWGRAFQAPSAALADVLQDVARETVNGYARDGVSGIPGRSGPIPPPNPDPDIVFTGDWRAERIDGGAGDDVLNGRGGNDTINGGAGADDLQGGAGNDSLSGGDSNDKLHGGADNDRLDGGAGADTMTGGHGNDVFIVNSTGDQTIEGYSAGYDTVISSVSHVLGGNLEALTLSGTGNINATGNWRANVLTGNSGNNVLSGGRGDDRLVSGGGDDRMTGGAGKDTFVFNGPGSADDDGVVADFGVGADVLIINGVTISRSASEADLAARGVDVEYAQDGSLIFEYGTSASVRLAGVGADDFWV